jgi:LacI family transcriptional regulator
MDFIMAMPRPTVRTIAVALGLSRSTVSNALRGLRGVKAETRQRVRQKAEVMGYRAHPFAAEVMSQLRRRAQSKQVGLLAVLEMDEPNRPPAAALFNRQLLEGIEKRAGEMGFGAPHWTFGGAESLALRRLNQILQWRGIHGLLFLPTWSEPQFLDLDWTQFTAIYLDYLVRKPSLHTVCTDHFRTLHTALEQARGLGYRKAGFTVMKRADERLNGRWTGAYLGYLHDHPEMALVPPLLVDELKAENFLPWFREHDPDVVITQWLDAPRHMISAGAEIPRTHGYICLNVLSAPTGFSGFDLRPRLLGMRAAELVISQLAHGDRDIPAVPSNTLVPAEWIEGTTVVRRN